MCGGGGSDKAGKEANKLEQQRRAQVAAAIAAISNAFDYGSNADKAKAVQDRIAGISSGTTPGTVGNTVHIDLPSGGGFDVPVGGTTTTPGATPAEVAALNHQLDTWKTAAQQPYRDYSAAVSTNLNDDLAHQTGQATRNLKFGLARSGMSGGSVDVDANAELARERNLGALQVAQKGQNAYNDLMSKDQSTKQQLIGLAESGLSATDATTQSLEAVKNNIDNAKAAATYTSLDDVFGGLGQAYQLQQITQGLRNAQGLYPQVNNPNGSYYQARPNSGSVRSGY